MRDRISTLVAIALLIATVGADIVVAHRLACGDLQTFLIIMECAK